MSCSAVSSSSRSIMLPRKYEWLEAAGRLLQPFRQLLIGGRISPTIHVLETNIYIVCRPPRHGQVRHGPWSRTRSRPLTPSLVLTASLPPISISSSCRAHPRYHQRVPIFSISRSQTCGSCRVRLAGRQTGHGAWASWLRLGLPDCREDSPNNFEVLELPVESSCVPRGGTGG